MATPGRPSFLLWSPLALFTIGVGPVCAAFFFWDHGTKHGNIGLLGTLSYFAPLLSTMLLIAFGLAPATPAVGLACGLIVCGGLIASGVLRVRRRLPVEY